METKRHLWNKLAAITALLTMMFAVPVNTQAQDEKLDLWIAGTQVTSDNWDNLNDLPGVSGEVILYHSSGSLTLFLNNATIYSSKYPAIESNIHSLSIQFEGKNKMIGSYRGMRLLGNTWITSNGTSEQGEAVLDVEATDGIGIEVSNCSMDVAQFAILNVKGNTGIVGFQSAELAVRNDAIVTTDAKSGAIFSFKNIILERQISICAPDDAVYDKKLKGIAKDGSLVKDRVVIGPVYDLKVGGMQVTATNYNDLSVNDFVEGNASYDRARNILNLNGATVGAPIEDVAIESGIPDLKIKLGGVNKVNGSNYPSMLLRANTFIYGPGQMDISAGYNCGIYLEGGNLTVGQRCRIGITGDYAIAGDGKSPTQLYLNNSTLQAEGREAVISSVPFVVLNGCYISEPLNAKFDVFKGGLVVDGALLKGKAVIEPSYGFTIAGQEVTPLNCNDLKVIDGVTGDLAMYDPATKTLTLKNAFIIKDSYYGLHNMYADELNIVVQGLNNISSNVAMRCDMDTKTCITGDGSMLSGGSLYLDGKSIGLSLGCSSSLVVEEIELNARGDKRGITGDSYTYGLRDERSTVTVQNYAVVEALGPEEGSIREVRLVLNKCAIHEPLDAEYDIEKGDITLWGKIVKAPVIIYATPEDVGIDAVGADLVPVRRQGIYNLQGARLTQDWESLPKGIYIVDGVKRVKW